jgi:hypothetical protein
MATVTVRYLRVIESGLVIMFSLCNYAMAAAEYDAFSAQKNPATESYLADTYHDYDVLRSKIAYGKASLAEVRQALTENQAGGLTNTVHALYSMRWHRGVIKLLEALWLDKRADYPELAWQQIELTPVRIALASTINRIQTFETQEYLQYIRAHAEDKHEFHRAQVVIALGLNGDPQDVAYITAMAEGDNHYVAQSAITALTLMNSQRARDAMITLEHKHRGTPRGELLEELLLQLSASSDMSLKVR